MIVLCHFKILPIEFFVLFYLDKFIELLGVLAAYSITVKELKTLFAALQGKNERWVCLTGLIKLINGLPQLITGWKNCLNQYVNQF